MRYRRLLCVAIIIGLGVLLAAATESAGTAPTSSTMEWCSSPWFKTTAWLHSAQTIYPGTLLMRGDDTAPDTWWLALDGAQAVYRYDAAHQQLDAMTMHAWEALHTPVVNCATQIPPLTPTLKLDERANAVVLRDSTRWPTTGRLARVLQWSPSQRLVAILSASGWRRGSILPFLSGGSVGGPYYHEVFTGQPPLRRLGAPIRVPIPSHTNVSACWSADERAVVYKGVVHSGMAIITAVPPAADTR